MNDVHHMLHRVTAAGGAFARVRHLCLIGGLFLVLASLTGCPASYPDCDDDSDCASHNEVCVGETCRQCRDDSQCTALDACMTCQANECVKRPGCCKSDLDCPDGKCWKDAGAETGTCGGECRGSEGCPEGQRCSNGSCVPDSSCSDDSFCPEGQKCIDGECQVPSCSYETVYFDFNEYAIRLDQESTVEANAECAKTRSASVRIEGHCDERGSDEYNLALGQRRAGAVASQYETLGVRRGDMNVISYGEERPVCRDSRESCWRENRRVETLAR